MIGADSDPALNEFFSMVFKTLLLLPRGSNSGADPHPGPASRTCPPFKTEELVAELMQKRPVVSKYSLRFGVPIV